MRDSVGEISQKSFKPRARVFFYLDRQIEGKERWGRVENSGGEMSWGSLRPGAGIFIYLDGRMEGEEK